MPKPSNPWKNFNSSQPYVLDQDKPYVDAFNELIAQKKAGGHPHHQRHQKHNIRTEFLPEPRLGPIDAPVVLLQLNPSIDGEPPTSPADTRFNNELKSLNDQNCAHIGIANENAWWTRKTGHLQRDLCNLKLEEYVCSIEYFPYRSEEFSHGSIRLPSQRYTFELVRHAINNKARIIVARSFRLWVSAVPELMQYAKVIVLNNPRNVAITKANMPPGEYKGICDAIREAHNKKVDLRRSEGSEQ